MNISQNQIEDFKRDGVVVIKNFYDFTNEILPIQKAICSLVNIVSSRVEMSCVTLAPEVAMGPYFVELMMKDRKLGGVIYDAVKQIPEFISLVSSAKNTRLFEMLRPNSFPAVAAGGYGIRIDIPSEEKFKTFWHQEFPAQMRSLDGLVYWSPLLEVTHDMGPVEIALGSHSDGLRPLQVDDGGIGKAGAYAMRLRDEDQVVSSYGKTAPLTKPGDLIVMDFLTLHQSGRNISSRPRWSMQSRLFNFRDPIGSRIDWAGAFAEGKSLDNVFDELAKLGL